MRLGYRYSCKVNNGRFFFLVLRFRGIFNFVPFIGELGANKARTITTGCSQVSG